MGRCCIVEILQLLVAQEKEFENLFYINQTTAWQLGSLVQCISRLPRHDAQASRHLLRCEKQSWPLRSLHLAAPPSETHGVHPQLCLSSFISGTCGARGSAIGREPAGRDGGEATLCLRYVLRSDWVIRNVESHLQQSNSAVRRRRPSTHSRIME